MPKRRRSRSLAHKGTSAADAIDEGAAKKMPMQRRDSRPSTFFGQQPASTIVVPSRFCHGSTVIAFEGPLSKERRSREARRSKCRK